MTESIKPLQIVAGIVISILILLFTRHIFDRKNYTKVYDVSSWRFILYLLYLVYLIFKSGFETIWRIVLKLDETCVSEYRLRLTGSFSRCLLANAITLTPGTVSIDLSGDTLTILSFKTSDGKPAVNAGTLVNLERILERRYP